MLTLAGGAGAYELHSDDADDDDANIVALRRWPHRHAAPQSSVNNLTMRETVEKNIILQNADNVRGSEK